MQQHPNTLDSEIAAGTCRRQQGCLRGLINDVVHNSRRGQISEIKIKCGLAGHPERRCVGEIGYFIDRAYWGRGFATKALQLLEQEVFEKHGVHRIELLTLKKNKASQRVAEKAGYQKEGISRGVILHEGKHQDAYLFARLKPEERA